MKTRLAYVLFIQLFRAQAELILKHLTEGESLDLCWAPVQARGPLTGLHLYHRSAHSQTTLLSVSEGGEVRVDPERRPRLQLSGGLGSLTVNVSISGLQRSDGGCYMWELSYREQDGADHILRSAHIVFLEVEPAGRPCQRSASYQHLLLIISAAAGLLLITLILMALDKCLKTRHRPTPQLHSPIYEEMSRKQQQSPGSPRNNHEAPSQLEEANFPVYANPNIRQLQDNYYACPRQLALRA
ncbi:uncharacterized protein LOC133422422 [Cololabis saira]|uniref:uncharacterized protein LOC133422422 n=1 Tax=Cololabis saira TaxID=129043 RepID=UPI002AD28D2D|nr:uncharacterized protein LOC133422422 [Cololabis saira]